MEQNLIKILFALIRSAMRGTEMSDSEKALYSNELLPDLMKLSKRHDVAHLVALGLKNNGLLTADDKDVESEIVRAVFRYERLNHDYKKLCATLEAAEIPFIPLKGSVLRAYYPEPWMRTSCDIDVLVHREDVERAIACLTENLKYTAKESGTHDVSLFSPLKNHVELHFDLVEEGRANNAGGILRSVWDKVAVRGEGGYWYEMSDAFFYFYHVAHMAKHFETGGCGIRPFIDLYILDKLETADRQARDELLEGGGLLRFAEAARDLSLVWLEGKDEDERSCKLQSFLLHGGAYGSFDNRVALQQKNKGGRVGYMLSRAFIPYERLVRYYPVLEKHRWLMPVMQVRRWFMLFRPDVAKMAKKEISVNSKMESSTADDMGNFLREIGLS